MIDHLNALLRLRAHLLTLEVLSTVGLFSATPDGFVRAEGSFIEDGFFPGMEVRPVGFDHRDPCVVRVVTAAALFIEGGRIPEAEALRGLLVELPALRAWENVAFKPEDGRWYVDENYLPGGVGRITVAPNAEFDAEPSYVLKLYGLSGRGSGALHRVSDAILKLFKPGSWLQIPDGYLLRVKIDPAPYKGEVLPEEASHALVVITIPLAVRFRNT
jgi:hypothetical protein